MGDIIKVAKFKKLINLTSTKISYEAMTRIVTKDPSVKLMLIILKNYNRHTATYHSSQKN